MKELITILNSLDTSKINSKEIKEKFEQTIINLIKTNEYYDKYKENDTKYRYSDYCNFSLSFADNLEYFFTTTPDNSLESYIGYIEFFIKHELQDFVELLEDQEIDDINDVIDIMDNTDYYDELIYMTGILNQKIMERLNIVNADEDDLLAFLNDDTEYKILFDGFALNDLRKLEKKFVKPVIRKIAQPLATEQIIPYSKGIEHVRDLYNFPISRIQVANDYRIAYLRQDKVTVILGISLKNGHNSDYTRYDTIAKKKEALYGNIKLFQNNLLDPDHQHYESIEFLKSFVKKNNKIK